uniref:FGFR1 oncogene partner (FOP) N-terminal dimerisation domain-containing protein n=1 Tax=Percolomonas cosmopolitus TaxID=63605 RepID=A0A7S1KTW2_9EUKA
MSLQQLKQELKQNLEHKGTLSHIRANLRASIFQILSQASPEGTQLPKENQTQAQILLHLLIMDYFKWIGYKFTASVFEQEAGLGASEQEFSRDFLAKEIGMNGTGDALDVAVLYSLMQKIVREKRGSVEVTDSLENLKTAWMRHEKRAEEESVDESREEYSEEQSEVSGNEDTTAYEEYSTDLEVSSTNDASTTNNTTTRLGGDDTTTEGATTDEESDDEAKAFVLKR